MKIGAVVLIGPLSLLGAPARYQLFREMALDMEAAGLDSIWVYDHLLFRLPGQPTDGFWSPTQPTDGFWEGWTMLTALAAVTRRVEVGTLVANAQLRNPALLAKMAVTLDEVSNGRLILGLGAGWHQPEFEAFGLPFDHRASRFEEAISIIKPLLREGRVDFHGTYYSARDCQLVPRGPREAGPPLLLAGKGPRMVDIVARQADIWNTWWHGEPSSVLQPLASMREACERAGRDPATIASTVSVSLVYTDLGGLPSNSSYLTGGLADALHGYAELGVAHVIVEFVPFTKAAFERFAGEVASFRAEPSRPNPAI